MDRTKAIELLKNAVPAKTMPNEELGFFIEAINMAIKALDKDIDVPTKWIPVSERLPEEGRGVLITKEPLKIQGYKQEVVKAKRSVEQRSGKIEWWSPEFGALADKTVLAWMPLPEPYKEGE